MNDRYQTGAKAAALVLFSMLAVVIAITAISMMIVSEQGYLLQNEFQPFMLRIYAQRGVITAAGVIAVPTEIVLFLYLMSAAGHSAKRDGVTCGFVDRIVLEVYLALAAIVLYALFAAAYIVLSCVTSQETLVFLWLAALCIACFAAAVMGALMSIAVRVKTGTLWKNTLVFLFLTWIARMIRSAWRGMRIVPTIWRALAIVCAVLLMNWVLILQGHYDGMPALLAFLLNVAIVIFCIVLLKQFKTVCRAAEHLAAGELDYQVPTRRMFLDLKRHGENLNRIGGAAALAVNDRMKSEHFRTELITNVSHDLKTPLTALISYIDLLKREGVQSENASEYLAVLDRQAQRLKKLTDDLVEASKAASGTLPVHCEEMNLGEFMRQCVGEYEDEFEKAQLQVVMGDMQDLHVFADGRHIWRVFDNLLGNVRKYAMPGTRVYIEACGAGGEVSILVRNISKEQLNISPSELMERFVRGDGSRGQTEGSGLGLSIVQSLMKLQNGRFDIYINGDLFTARVLLPLCEKDAAHNALCAQ